MMGYVEQMQSMGIINDSPSSSSGSFNEIQRRINQAQAIQRDPEQLTIGDSAIIERFKQAIEYQAAQFERFRQLTEQKFTTLSKDVLDLTMELKQARAIIQKLKDKEETLQARAALQAYQRGDAPPKEIPIDRNGVAPSEVQIEQIFNFSGKRF